MEINKLISSIKFGKKVESKLVLGEIDYKEYFILRSDFDSFLTQPLNLSHFVPAIEKDGEWIVLEEPKGTDVATSSFFEMQTDYHLEKEYQTALDKVVFKGWYIDFRDLETIVLSDANNNIIEFKENGDIYIFDEYLIKSIEDAIFYSVKQNIDIELTETIIKKFGL